MSPPIPTHAAKEVARSESPPIPTHAKEDVDLGQEESPEDGDGGSSEQQLVACPSCGRRFAEPALERLVASMFGYPKGSLYY